MGYHGKDNRGVTTINFLDEIKRSINDQVGLDFCGGEWKYPRGCSSAAENCQYHARWEFNENTDKMNFTIASRNPDKKNKWTGIGFSNNPSMRLTDAIIGWVEPNGRYLVMDMWTTNYLNPILEPSQDITDLSGELVDGVTTIRFARQRDTGDSQDVAFTDTEGMYMIFPVKGGRYNGVNKKIRKHEEVPIASTEKVYIKSCRTADGKPTFTTTPKPPQLMYTAKLKFVNLGNFKLPRDGTREFTELQAKISRSLRNTDLRRVPGFLDVAVTSFYSEGQGEFDSDLMIIVDKNEFEAVPEADALTVEDALQLTVDGGKIGNLHVDPSSLSVDGVQAPDESEPRDLSNGQVPNVKLYVVVACIAALVLVAIIQASCTIFKMSRRGSSVQKEKLLGQSSGRTTAGRRTHLHKIIMPMMHSKVTIQRAGSKMLADTVMTAMQEETHTASLEEDTVVTEVTTPLHMQHIPWDILPLTAEAEDSHQDRPALQISPPTTTSCPARGSTPGRC